MFGSVHDFNFECTNVVQMQQDKSSFFEIAELANLEREEAKRGKNTSGLVRVDVGT